MHDNVITFNLDDQQLYFEIVLCSIRCHLHHHIMRQPLRKLLASKAFHNTYLLPKIKVFAFGHNLKTSIISKTHTCYVFITHTYFWSLNLSVCTLATT